MPVSVFVPVTEPFERLFKKVGHGHGHGHGHFFYDNSPLETDFTAEF